MSRYFLRWCTVHATLPLSACCYNGTIYSSNELLFRGTFRNITIWEHRTQGCEKATTATASILFWRVQVCSQVQRQSGHMHNHFPAVEYYLFVTECAETKHKKSVSGKWWTFYLFSGCEMHVWDGWIVSRVLSSEDDLLVILYYGTMLVLRHSEFGHGARVGLENKSKPKQ